MTDIDEDDINWRCEWCKGKATDRIWHYDLDGCHEICDRCYNSVDWKDGKPIRTPQKCIDSYLRQDDWKISPSVDMDKLAKSLIGKPVTFNSGQGEGIVARTRQASKQKARQRTKAPPLRRPSIPRTPVESLSPSATIF
jgi:hypothetical protein